MTVARARKIDDRAPSPAPMPEGDASSHGDLPHWAEGVTRTTAVEPARVSRSSALAGSCFLLGLALLGMAVRWSGLPAAAECRASPGALVFGVDKRVGLATKAGVWCPVPLRMPAAAIDDVAVLSAPENGVAMTDHRKEAIYRAFPGFRGEDAFTLTIRGRSRMYSGTSVLRVTVTVD